MTIFVEVTPGNGTYLRVTGEKYGTVYGNSIEDACMKLLSNLTKDDTAYVDARGIGAAVVDILSKYCNVMPVYLKKPDMIGTSGIMAGQVDSFTQANKDKGYIGKFEPYAVDVMVHVDKEMLKWMWLDKFPDDPAKLADKICEAVCLSYERM